MDTRIYLQEQNKINLDRKNYFLNKGDTLRADFYERMIMKNNQQIENMSK